MNILRKHHLSTLNKNIENLRDSAEKNIEDLDVDKDKAILLLDDVRPKKTVRFEDTEYTPTMRKAVKKTGQFRREIGIFPNFYK